MFRLETLMVLVPALPLAAAVVIAALGKPLLGRHSHLPAVAAIVGSFVLSLFLYFQVREAASASSSSIGFERTLSLWTWAAVDDAYDRAAVNPSATVPNNSPATIPADFLIDVSLRADPLTAVMLVMVTFVSSLVVLYSIGYVQGDPGYWRFFAYVSLFVFSMTMLVSVSNFVLLYVFWEAVGVCSYLLIGFWYEKPAAAAAGKKAFLVNRVGDFGFALGLFLLWTTYGTLNFHDSSATGETHVVPGILGQTMLAQPSLYVGGSVGLGICMCLLAGACGKSAQFPLHVWLPDAMEGPTPVSALIHAATMVTAGVYLLARCAPLFVFAPHDPYMQAGQLTVAAIGCASALMAGVIAMTQTDLKRVLAYSTISQLGYMFLGVGTATLAGVTAGMFHLFTHAFFKALLFLGAGSVMHAMGGVIDMRRFGGLWRLMPWTCATFAIGSLTLAGFPGLSGWWSKDAVLAAVHDKGRELPVYNGLYYAALFTACLTAIYTFRAFFLTFFGPARVPEEAAGHAHESPRVMTWPLVVLAICALGIGFAVERNGGFSAFLARTPSLAFRGLTPAATEHSHGNHAEVAAVSSVLALTGIGLAAFLYLGHQNDVNRLTRIMRRLGLYQLSYGKFFFDAIYAAFVVWPLWLLALAINWIDRWLIDGLVNLCGRAPQFVGAALRPIQTGLVQFYALAMVLGLLVLLGTLLIWPAG